jgi:hypothetical protein
MDWTTRSRRGPSSYWSAQDEYYLLMPPDAFRFSVDDGLTATKEANLV